MSAPQYSVVGRWDELPGYVPHSTLYTHRCQAPPTGGPDLLFSGTPDNTLAFGPTSRKRGPRKNRSTGHTHIASRTCDIKTWHMIQTDTQHRQYTHNQHWGPTHPAAAATPCNSKAKDCNTHSSKAYTRLAVENQARRRGTPENQMTPAPCNPVCACIADTPRQHLYKYIHKRPAHGLVPANCIAWGCNGTACLIAAL